jgi:hypothetical protein
VASQYFRFSARAVAAPRRAALLEQLLARADDFRQVADWRADAFRVIAPQGANMPAIAAAALFADCATVDVSARATVDAPWTCLATPVHYAAEMASVRMAPDGILSVTCAHAQLLAQDFNRVWKDSGIRLTAGGSARLYCIFDRTLEVATRDPEDVLERHIEEYLPAGADAARLRLLMSEIEMWLFDHSVNGSRESSGLPRISGLWLWGGGAPLASLPRVEGFFAGDDVFFGALGLGALGPTNTAESNSGVIAAPQTPGDDAWSGVEKSWLAPAAARLRTGRLSRLDISAGNRCFTLTARAMRRFWRRRKPWWESFA